MTLSHHREERDALLAQILSLLEDDPRVRAAFLFGSLGRGEEDDLSDLDVIVVADDTMVAALRKSSAGQVAYLPQAGPLIGHLGGPQNAPRGGVYRMALYDGTQGAHQVDWYFLPESASFVTAETIPYDVRLLYDRIGLAQKPRHSERFSFEPSSTDISNPEHAFLSPEGIVAEENRDRMTAFWAMLAISAKYVARQTDGQELFLGEMVRNLLRGLAELGEVEDFVAEEGALPIATTDKIAYLRYLSTHARGLLSAIATKGTIGVPFRLATVIERYIDLIETITSLADSMASAIETA